MTTVRSIMARLTDPAAIHQEVRATLRALDPDYREEETKFQAAASLLSERVPGADRFLGALERIFTTDLIHLGHQGFQFNLECFTNPPSRLLLNEDFETLHLEHRMAALPLTQAPRQAVDDFLRTLPPEEKQTANDILDHYAYLQTTAYKLAHYFGFLLADELLYYAVPGYAKDAAMTNRYTRKLRDFLELDVHTLTGEP